MKQLSPSVTGPASTDAPLSKRASLKLGSRLTLKLALATPASAHIRRWQTLARECSYNSNRLAALLQITPKHLQRYFKFHFGRTPQDWLDHERMIASTHLLRENLQVKFVAAELGFKDRVNFSRTFKKTFHLTPSDFQRLYCDSRSG